MNTTYAIDFPAMNSNDRLIMDTRSTTWMKIIDLKFTSGGVLYNLLDFIVAESNSSKALGAFYSRYQIADNNASPCGRYYNNVRLSE